MTSVHLGSLIKRDEEIVKSTLRAMLLRAGVLVTWLLLIIGICVSVLLLR